MDWVKSVQAHLESALKHDCDSVREVYLKAHAPADIAKLIAAVRVAQGALEYIVNGYVKGTGRGEMLLCARQALVNLQSGEFGEGE